MVGFARTTVVMAQFLFCCTSAHGADAIFHDRDGHSDIPKLRQWLWEHWHRHTAGTATLKWITVEGDEGTSDYAISKDAAGTWYLSIHLRGSDRFAEGDAAAWRD